MENSFLNPCHFLQLTDGNSPCLEKTIKNGNRRGWSKNKEEELLNVLDNIIANGARCDTSAFKAGTSTQIEKTLNSVLPNSGIKASPHIDSKIRSWKKKQYGIVFDMLNTSGFGWNDTKKCVEVDSNEVWEMYVLVSIYFIYCH